MFVSDFAEQGVLPSALVNFVALLGWSPGEGGSDARPHAKEGIFLTMDELAKAFDLSQVNRAPAIVDPTRLKFLNAQHVHLAPAGTASFTMMRAALATAADTFEKDTACDTGDAPDDYVDAVLALARPTYATVEDLVDGAKVFWVAPTESAYRSEPATVAKLFAKEQLSAALRDAVAQVDASAASRADWKRALKAAAKSQKWVV